MRASASVKRSRRPAFLVETEREAEFDRRVEALGDAVDGRLRVKYVGPVPPSNFVEIVVTW